ncbi:related to RAD27 - 5' to 3' exonuclease [Moesziomyces antarcticus]|uniref:Related to RAD27 - 5' to 3' exonuclease n=1 Tax=Pseudozyma antarctica TaxID=84753 RepID=A0A5C3FYA5_PSEA2|nr:related to RAD27 - 5' to 3' exonuclease [Moesziomyces antarcticus]
MRASPVCGGIRGIFPLIRSLVPQAISPPFALSSLRGLRLAIDATLLVQRLHFADDPHPARHVVGFYRLVTSLRQHGIVPIMVFDHPHKRLALKDREQLKRKHKRELDRVRSRLEQERHGRLQELQSHLDAIASLAEDERRQVGELLDQWQSQSAPTQQPMHANYVQLEQSLSTGASSQSRGQRLLAQAEKQVYQTITAQLISGEAVQPPPALSVPDISTTIDTLPPPSLSSLNAMHHSLSKTYDRATSPLSASIYQDCAALCSLMQTAVFWTGDGTRTGGGRIHEAEAYAASLVRAGFADLVASEDSDVLLYEAPLLRGLMAAGKLEVVCGTRVRRGLFPREEVDRLVQMHSQGEAEAEEVAYDRTTRALMLDFALLCGTDFNRTVPGIGPKTALRLLKEHGSIGTILRKEAKFGPPDALSVREYETELRQARSVFLQPPKVRAAARSILGTAAFEAATQIAAQPTTPQVDRLIAGGEPATARTEDKVVVEDAAMGDGEAVDCTAEPTAAEVLDSISTPGVIEASPSTSVEPSSVRFDRQAVHDFLRSRGVFRSSLPDSHDLDYADRLRANKSGATYSTSNSASPVHPHPPLRLSLMQIRMLIWHWPRLAPTSLANATPSRAGILTWNAMCAPKPRSSPPSSVVKFPATLLYRHVM